MKLSLRQRNSKSQRNALMKMEWDAANWHWHFASEVFVYNASTCPVQRHRNTTVGVWWSVIKLSFFDQSVGCESALFGCLKLKRMELNLAQVHKLRSHLSLTNLHHTYYVVLSVHRYFVILMLLLKLWSSLFIALHNLVTAISTSRQLILSSTYRAWCRYRLSKESYCWSNVGPRVPV